MGWPFTKDDMGEDARDYVARNCKEGVDPRTDIEDYGDYDEDHSEQEHKRSDGWGGDVQTYYDTTRRDTFRLL